MLWSAGVMLAAVIGAWKMSVQDRIAEARGHLPGCDTLALVDPTLSMVLCAASGRKRPREEIDQLGASAGLLMRGVVAQALTRAEAGNRRVVRALVVTGPETEVFLQGPAAEVLSAHGDAALCLDGLAAIAPRVFAALADGGEG